MTVRLSTPDPRRSLHQDRKKLRQGNTGQGATESWMLPKRGSHLEGTSGNKFFGCCSRKHHHIHPGQHQTPPLRCLMYCTKNSLHQRCLKLKNLARHDSKERPTDSTSRTRQYPATPSPRASAVRSKMRRN